MRILLRGDKAEEVARHIVDYARSGIRKKMLLKAGLERADFNEAIVIIDRRLIGLNPHERVLILLAVVQECLPIGVTAEEVA
jgi:hypothetical protein